MYLLVSEQYIDPIMHGTRDGGTNYILRIKEQGTRLNLHEHNDDDDDDDDDDDSMWTLD